MVIASTGQAKAQRVQPTQVSSKINAFLDSNCEVLAFKSQDIISIDAKLQ